MARLLLRGLLFLGIGTALLHALSYMARTFAPDGTSMFLAVDRQNVQVLLENRSQAEAIVVGNSHGDDVDFSVMGLHGFQLSRAWGDFFETEYYLKYLVPRLQALKVVFMPVSYFSFGWDNAAAGKLSLRRVQMYEIIPAWWFVDGDLVNYVKGRGSQIFPVRSIMREDNWRSVFWAILSGVGQQGPVTGFEQDCKYKPPEELAGIARSRVLDAVRITRDVRRERMAVHADTYAAAARVIRYLQGHSVRPVFFTPPYYKAYTLCYRQEDPDSVARLQAVMSRLAGEFGVEYYDFSADPGFSDDHRVFHDSDHLNLCGKRLFSRALDERLRRPQACTPPCGPSTDDAGR